jgi:hypothetical protein
VFLVLGFHSHLAYSQTSSPPSIVTIDGLGKGAVDLSGPWRFHIGDSLEWARPNINDAPGENGWEAIRPDLPWGTQGHYAYAGFGWYRLYLHITPAPDVTSRFRLLLPRLEDACEVYWNGKLVGQYGTLPPHPSWPATNAPVAIRLSGSPSGTLAILVWKGPLGSSESGDIGGLTATPLVADVSWRMMWYSRLNIPFAPRWPRSTGCGN